MNLNDSVTLIERTACMSGYPCHIKAICDGEYYVCSEFSCKWVDESEFEVAKCKTIEGLRKLDR